MDEAQLTAELRAVDADARLVIAVFAVVGRASLSVPEVGELSGLPEPRPVVDDLERRGLLVRESGDRYAVAAGVQGRLRRLLASADVVDRVLRGFIVIAEDGRLTIDDLDAVLELTRLAAETGRWAELLRLAEAAESVLATTHRVEEWAEIVDRRLEAARVMGDEDGALCAERELQRISRLVPATAAPTSPVAQQRRSGGGLRTALAVLGVIAVGAVGVGVGYLIADQAGDGDTAATETETPTETATETETVTVGGGTDTVTVTETETVTETVTETETETVTESPVG